MTDSNIQSLLPIHVEGNKQTISAKQLYEFLGFNKSRWSKWYKKNIEENKFYQQGEDWNPLDLGSNANGTPNMDFEVTVDFGKRISMQAPGEKGDTARTYFIACEKKALYPVKELNPAEMLLQSVQLLVDQQKEVEGIKERMNILEAHHITHPQDYFTIAGYASLVHRKMPISEAAGLGRKATKLCADLGYSTGSMVDPRFGTVKTYPNDVLETIFNEN